MNNLKYLEMLKKDNLKEFIIKSARSDLEIRRLSALEIIAETLINICGVLEDFATTWQQRN